MSAGAAADPATVVPPRLRPHRGRCRARLLLSGRTPSDPRTSRASPRGPSLSPVRRPRKPRPPGLNPNVFIHVGPDGTVTIVCHRSEMGQGIRSSLPVLIADELGAQMARVKIVQADGDKAYGDQNTDGSNSIRGIYEDMRRVGATARVMLVATAAKRWKVRAEDCVARDHAVTHLPTGRALGFGELALEAGKQKVPAAKDVALRPVSELTHLGKPLPLLDGPAYVTGQAIYGADIKIPGMLTAVIARPPVVGGKVARFDADASVGGTGRSQSDRDPAAEAALRLPAMGRGRRGRGPHVGGHAWTSRARRDVGAWPERQLRFGPVPRRPRQGGGGARERSHARSVIRRRR